MLNLYALVGVGAVVVGLGGYAAIQHHRADAASARAEQAESRAASLTQALETSEEENAKLVKARKALDLALVERDRRARALEETKRKIQGELDAIKETVGEEDRRCLDKPLPPAILERLRNPGTADRDAAGEGTSPRITPDPVPGVVPERQ